MRHCQVEVKVSHCLDSVRLVGRFVGLKVFATPTKEGIDRGVTVKGGGTKNVIYPEVTGSNPTTGKRGELVGGCLANFFTKTCSELI